MFFSLLFVLPTQHHPGSYPFSQPITIDSDGVEHTLHIPITSYVTIMLAKNTRLTGVSNRSPNFVEIKKVTTLPSDVAHFVK